MNQYHANLSPPQLFVGTTFHNETEEEDAEGYTVTVEEYWEQETLESSYNRLKQGIESLGIKCLDIQFDEYIPTEGILPIKSITCEYEGDADLLNTLLKDEAYITTGISCYSWDNLPMVAVYFHK
jgi:hypothetical protein